MKVQCTLFLIAIVKLALCDEPGMAIQEKGDMYLYEDTKEIHFLINHTSFIETAKIIHENAKLIKKLCAKAIHKNCEFFIKKHGV